MKRLFPFLLFLFYFSLLLPWDRFLDPDAFYHAHLSALLWRFGPINAFPWLDLTTLGRTWTDHHYLFHLIEAPFVAALGWATGARVTAVVLSALFISIFAVCLRWLGIKKPWPWAVLLATTSPLIVRLLLAKATPLALIFFVLGLLAVWRRRPVLSFVVAALAALSHGGGIYLLVASWILCFGNAVHRRIVGGESFRDATRHAPWRECIAVISGIAFGLILHPNFPDNISFLWTQIVTIGVSTPFQHVILGQEWQPSEIGSFFSSFALWWIAAFVGIAGIFFAPKRPLDRNAARAITSFALLVAAFVALTIKSRRNAEYFAPVIAIWVPLIWEIVDVRELWRFFCHSPVGAHGNAPASECETQIRFDTGRAHYHAPLQQKFVHILLATLLSILFLKGPITAYTTLHSPGYPDSSFVAAMASVSERANSGDRVFHSDWDEFPVLWNIDDRLKYVAGLDPTFLYQASSTLSDAYRDLTWGATTPTKEQAWEFINDKIGARFVFIAKSDHEQLLDFIKSDERYKPLIETEDAAMFEVW
ncbi:MAG: hypothetical protein AAB386_05515 [Patescibacteria group bacterium]